MEHYLEISGCEPTVAQRGGTRRFFGKNCRVVRARLSAQMGSWRDLSTTSCAEMTSPDSRAVGTAKWFAYEPAPHARNERCAAQYLGLAQTCHGTGTALYEARANDADFGARSTSAVDLLIDVSVSASPLPSNRAHIETREVSLVPLEANRCTEVDPAVLRLTRSQVRLVSDPRVLGFASIRNRSPRVEIDNDLNHHADLVNGSIRGVREAHSESSTARKSGLILLC